MKKSILIMFAVAFFGAILVSQVSIAGEGAHQYVGAKKCKMCHMSKSKGAQFKIWQDSAHAGAYHTLTTDKAKEVYAKAVPGGTDNPAELDKCLSCHSTGYGAAAEAFAETFDKTEGVGCEACHGPGSDYQKMSVMKDKDQSIAAGLVVPNAETCTGCHNEKSPTYKDFDFDTFLAKIAHPAPEK
jgi:hypothetical protein